MVPCPPSLRVPVPAAGGRCPRQFASARRALATRLAAAVACGTRTGLSALPASVSTCQMYGTDSFTRTKKSSTPTTKSCPPALFKGACITDILVLGRSDFHVSG